jgi:acyl-CoA synthetase (AMP-forming)/AMP-acid ligase II
MSSKRPLNWRSSDGPLHPSRPAVRRIRFPNCCSNTRECGRAGRPTARRITEFGRAGAGRRSPAEVEALACGLAAIGFRRGDKLAIIGDNQPRLYWAIAATQALGGVPVPIYQDAIAEEMAFVLDSAEVGFAVAEDQEQVDKPNRAKSPG